MNSPWLAISLVAVSLAAVWVFYAGDGLTGLLLRSKPSAKSKILAFALATAVAWVPSCGGLAAFARIVRPVPETFGVPGRVARTSAVETGVNSIGGMFVAAAVFETSGETWEVGTARQRSWGKSIGGGPGTGSPGTDPVSIPIFVHIPNRPDLVGRQIEGTVKGSFTYPAYSGAGTFTEKTAPFAAPLTLHIGSAGLLENMQVGFFGGVGVIDTALLVVGALLFVVMMCTTAALLVRGFPYVSSTVATAKRRFLPGL